MMSPPAAGAPPFITVPAMPALPAVAMLRCPTCHRLVLVNVDGYAACSACGAVYLVAVQVIQPAHVRPAAGG